MKVEELKIKFIEIFGGKKQNIRAFSSPGRVNLIGEHTDYNGGYVLPAALTVSSNVVVRPRKDRQINLIATDLNIMVNASLDRLDNFRNLKWGSYQIGVADELQKAGYKLTGCDMLFHDMVPLGAGLSSSAAIEIAAGLAFLSCREDSDGEVTDVDMKELALLSQKAENNFIGVNCGIMDQFASAMGKANHAIFLNCRNLEYKLVPLRLKGYEIVITNTNKKRSLADSKYNERRRECESGLEMLKNSLSGINCLGDLSLSDLTGRKNMFKDETIYRRLLHVVSENTRVTDSVKALEKDDIALFGKLMCDSHESLKYNYEVTGNELDVLAEEAVKIKGVAGSRMTGAGFGGCTVSIVRSEAIDEFIDEVGNNYTKRTGLTASFYVSRAGDGGREVYDGEVLG
jgi:galactokinase